MDENKPSPKAVRMGVDVINVAQLRDQLATHVKWARANLEKEVNAPAKPEPGDWLAVACRGYLSATASLRQMEMAVKTLQDWSDGKRRAD